MNTFTRRALLRTFAGTSVAAATLRNWTSWAETGVFPKRLLIVYSSAGRDSDSQCTGTGSTFSLGTGYAPLEPWKKKLLVLDGLRIPEHVNEEHPNGRCSMLTARAATPNGATGQSIDRFLAAALTNGRSVFCGPSGTRAGGGVDMPVSWNSSNVSNDAYLDGRDAVLSSLFSGAVNPQPPTGGTDPTKPSAATLNAHALNRHLKQEMERLRKVVPRTDIDKFELHLTALEQIRASLPTLDGQPIGMPQSLPTCNSNVPNVMAEQDAVSLALAHAFACGRAQIAVMRLGGDEPIHGWSHWNDGPSFHDRLRALDIANSEAVARLLGYLDSIAEGAGTVLSNTLVVWTTEVAGGYGGGDIHGVENMPFILAGGLQGSIKTGQRLVLSGRRTCGELYRSIARAMGVSSAAGFGDPSFGGSFLDDVLV